MPRRRTTFIACSAFKDELAALAGKLGLSVRARFLDSALHMRPEALKAEVERLLREELEAGSRVVLLYGNCWAGAADPPASPSVVRVAGADCGEVLLGRVRYAALLAEGAFLLFPDWAERWEAIRLEFPDAGPALAARIEEEGSARLSYLDTGVRPVPDLALKACARYFGLPFETVETGLEGLEAALREAMGRLPPPAPEEVVLSRDRGSTAAMMLDIVTAVLEEAGDLEATAAGLSRKLRDLTGSRIVVLAGIDRTAEADPRRRIVIANPARHASIAERDSVIEMIDRSLSMTEAAVLDFPEEPGDARLSPCLVLPLSHDGARVGSILALGLMDESHVASILEVQDLLSTVVSVVLNNAFLLEREQVAKRRLASILEGTDAGTWEWDLGTDAVRANERSARMLGYSLAEISPVTMRSWESLVYPADQEREREALKAYLAGSALSFEAEYRARHKDGRLVWILTKGKASEKDSSGRPLVISGTHLDISARKEAEAKIRHMANHDALTGLPSLRLANDRLSVALGHARRRQELAAVMFLDLDGFKDVNDSLGHDAGDAVLREVAARLLQCVRESDTVARIGGDEFMIIACGLDSAQDAETIARKVVTRVAEPMAAGRAEAAVSASLGIALYPDDGISAGALIKSADGAMYDIKRAGKNGFAFASPSLPGAP